MIDTLIIFAAKYLIYIELLAFCGFILFSRRGVRARMLLMSLIALPLAYILDRIAGYFWYDTRPFVESGMAPLIAHAADNGFPSDHMLLASTMAAIITLRYPKWSMLFWLAAIATGTARVIARVHHPIDVVVSVLLAIISTYIAYEIVVLRRKRRRSGISV